MAKSFYCARTHHSVQCPPRSLSSLSPTTAKSNSQSLSEAPGSPNTCSAATAHSASNGQSCQAAVPSLSPRHSTSGAEKPPKCEDLQGRDAAVLECCSACPVPLLWVKACVPAPRATSTREESPGTLDTTRPTPRPGVHAAPNSSTQVALPQRAGWGQRKDLSGGPPGQGSWLGEGPAAVPMLPLCNTDAGSLQ